MSSDDPAGPDLEPGGTAGTAPPPSAAPPPPPDPGAAPSAPGQAYPSEPLANRLVDYIAANRSAFTDVALRDAAAAAGYPPEAIDAAFQRIAAPPGAGPVRDRARLIILGAYALVFLVLSAGMAANNSSGGIAILAISLGLFLLLSLFMVRGRTNDAERLQLALGGLLAVPLVLLVIIGGLCLATGLPLRPLTF